LSKATIGLAEFDRSFNNIEQIGKVSLEENQNKRLYQEFKKEIDEILSEYF